MRKILTCSLSFLLVFVFVSSVGAQDKLTPKEVIKTVNEAAEFLGKKGEDSFDVFNDEGNRFVSKEKNLYPYVAECAKNTARAHPIKPELIGKDLSNLQDPKGNYFTLEICMISEEHPERGGWIKYWWPKPGESEPSQKFAYVKKAEGTPYTVVAGFWSEDFTVDKLNNMLK